MHQPEKDSFEISYQELANAVPQMVWTVKPNGEADYFNRRWYEYTGLRPDGSLAWGWQKVVHPDDLEKTRRKWTQALRTGEPFEVEYRLRRFDEVYRWFIGRALPVRDKEDRILKWVGTCTDIEEKKREAEAFAARAAIVEMPDHPRWPGLKMQNVFPKLSRTPGAVRSPAPQVVGQHNDEVLGERLGLDKDALAKLRQDGVI